MAQTNVSSCVLSIVASFTSGLDVFKKFRESRSKTKRKTRKNGPRDEEELRLVRSLRQGPEDIGREYQKSVHTAGAGFAHGDAIAQTCLAEILLKLNTGLVTIINTFLTKTKGEVLLDYQSLTDLSEQSRIDTCRTLRRLHHRMMQASMSLRVQGDDYNHSSHPRTRSEVSETSKRSRKRPVVSPKHAKVRGPMLAKVVIADSTKPSQVAMVRPGMSKKKSRSSSNVASQKAQSDLSLALSLPVSSPSEAIKQLPPILAKPKSRSMAVVPHARGKTSASTIDVAHPPAEVPRVMSRSTPRLETFAIDQDPLPPIPSTIPLPPRPFLESRRRKPTPTYYSIESASTKLGEIPLHKWAQPYDFDAMSILNKEAERNGWPLSQLDPAHRRKKRRGIGIFRLFRKNG